ncbi:SDR family NAD(P)-dependent oxidoreductase [Dolosigranulum pigrum]|uniref:SDR family NAD(P)-dependent oxidoreductase n=1 Tax=Dolosigranulum pigrum TaxID=29394 RepID=UPI00191A0AD7|nr:SDR family NAD(P)-dependent oxidoreductase [Dolosigranulum pigrum]
MFNLDGQVALVTGGANGIGSGIVEALAEQGATVVIADIDEDGGQELAQKIDGAFLKLDVTDGQVAQNVVETVKAEYGRIDILAANTGIYPEVLLKDMDEASWDKVFDVNVKGMFNVVKPTLEVMKEQAYGRVILTSSITGDVTGYPGGTAYGASKAAQLGFMRNAAVEYGRYNITINAIQPGIIATESLVRELPTLNEAADYIPAKTLGEPQDIGVAAAFFAAKESKYITGQALAVDGGQVLPETPDVVSD